MSITTDMIISCVCSLIACCAFGIKFNIRLPHLIAAAAGSLVSKLIFMLMTANDFSDIRSTFMAAAAVSAYAEIMARSIKAPVNMYLIVGILPLVPGGLLYYTMLALIMGDNETFFERASDAFGSACAIAMGIFAISSAVKLSTDFYRQHKSKRKRGALSKKSGGSGIKNI